ncbi:MAG TPA: hypothetical protein VND96_12310 [Candidatus Micrarchaeaceae archaeon]|nr:hypothetical protein [Candidatus Micrarchaeaceae archaeon]
MKYGPATIVDELRSLGLQEPRREAPAVYDRPLEARPPYEDPALGPEHWLVRIQGGRPGRP